MLCLDLLLPLQSLGEKAGGRQPEFGTVDIDRGNVHIGLGVPNQNLGSKAGEGLPVTPRWEVQVHCEHIGDSRTFG